MGIPQIIILVLFALGLGITLAKDGEIQRFSFVSSLFGSAVQLSILYWGGFFG